MFIYFLFLLFLYGPYTLLAQPPPPKIFLSLPNSKELEEQQNLYKNALNSDIYLPENPAEYSRRSLSKNDEQEDRTEYQIVDLKNTDNVTSLNFEDLEDYEDLDADYVYEVVNRTHNSGGWLAALEQPLENLVLHLGSSNITEEVDQFFKESLGSVADNLSSVEPDPTRPATTLSAGVVQTNPFAGSKQDLAAAINFQLDDRSIVAPSRQAGRSSPKNLVNLFKWWDELPANASETPQQIVSPTIIRQEALRLEPELSVVHPIETPLADAQQSSSLLPFRGLLSSAAARQQQQPNLLQSLLSQLQQARKFNWPGRTPQQLFPRNLQPRPRLFAPQRAQKPLQKTSPSASTPLRIVDPKDFPDPRTIRVGTSIRPSLRSSPSAKTAGTRGQQQAQKPQQRQHQSPVRSPVHFASPNLPEVQESIPLPKPARGEKPGPTIRLVDPSAAAAAAAAAAVAAHNVTWNPNRSQRSSLVLPRLRTTGGRTDSRLDRRENRLERRERKRSELELEIDQDLKVAQEAYRRGQSAADIIKSLSEARQKKEPTLNDIIKGLTEKFALQSDFPIASASDLQKLQKFISNGGGGSSPERQGNLLSAITTEAFNKDGDSDIIVNDKRLNRKLNRILGRFAQSDGPPEKKERVEKERVQKRRNFDYEQFAESSSPAPPPLRSSIRIVSPSASSLIPPPPDNPVTETPVQFLDPDSRQKLLVWRHAKLLEEFADDDQFLPRYYNIVNNNSNQNT